MRIAAMGLGLALCVAPLVTGCGQDTKRENEQLKARVGALQRENLALKGDSTTLKADAEAMKKQLETLTQERQALEEQVKEMEAKIAAKPATRPPVKPKKMSAS